MSERAAEFLTLLDGELERRRHAALTAAGGDGRQWVMQTLDEMAARMRAAPEWKEPTPAQQRRNAHKVEMWFRRNGYELD
jgi:hypothetical protein